MWSIFGDIGLLFIPTFGHTAALSPPSGQNIIFGLRNSRVRWDKNLRIFNASRPVISPYLFTSHLLPTIAFLEESFLFLKWANPFSFIFIFSNTHFKFYSKYKCQKLSIQDMEQGFEFMNFET